MGIPMGIPIPTAALTFKPERQKIQTLITWKLLSRSWRNFYRKYALRVCLRGWSHGSPNKSKMAAATIFNFGKMPIILDQIKISEPNFMGRCTVTMRIWSRDQNLKPEVNSRDCHQMKVRSINSSISVTITNIWTKFGTEHKYHTTNTPEWQLHINWKSKMAAAAILNFGKMSITLDWIKISCIELYGKMQHGDAEMTTWPKVETGS